MALYDLTTFGKFLLRGPDAAPILQRLCANDLDVPPGRIVYTQLLNPRGGIECDLTATRTGEDAFRITTGAAARTHDLDWLRRNIPPEARVSLTDVTSAQAVLGVMGPRARDLMAAVSGADLSNEAFPFATSQEIELGFAPARAQRVSFVGELGWEVFLPTEFAPAAFDLLDAAGRDLGLRHAGLHALDCCRMEKAFRHWGHDLSGHTTPLEAGLGFAVALDRGGNFIGRDALLRQKEAGTRKRLVLFTIDEGTPLVLHDEPIYRDGALVGATTSGTYAPTLGKCLAFGYVETPDGVDRDFILSGRYEIEIAARRYRATPGLRAPYDPTGARMRA